MAAAPRTLSPYSSFWRRLAYLGARRGPRCLLRYSPAFFGVLFALLLPRHRAAVRRNLRWLLGRRGVVVEARDVLRTFTNYAKCLAEGLATERPDAARAGYPMQGERYFREVLSDPGRGVILATAHAGPWDAASRALSQVVGERPVMVVMAREPDAEAARLHDGIRSRGGVQVVHVGEHPLDALPLVSHLDQGGICAIQLDRLPQGGQTIEVSLAGRPYRLPRGPFMLAATAEVPILPLFATRVGYFQYELSAHPPVTLPRRPTPEQLAAAAQSAADVLARFLVENPTQWFHFELPPRPPA